MSAAPRIVHWTEGSAIPVAAAAVAMALGGRSPLAEQPPFDRWEPASRGGARRLAVPGGRTAAALFDALAATASGDGPDWTRVELFFVDERAVPPGHSDSNHRLATERLASRAGIPSRNVHRMRAEDPDLDRAARDYEALLGAPLDLVVLGLAEDGHVASLFPGSPLLHERRRRVAPVLDSPKPPARRLTLTPRALAEADAVLVIAEGAARREAALRALSPGPPDEAPARVVANGLWLLGSMGPPAPDYLAAGGVPAPARR